MTAHHRTLEDSDLALIEQVKQTPSLYDPRNPDFRLAYRKEQDWEVVATEVAMTSTEARRRWTCLRDRYTRELKQLRMHPDKSEYGNNDFFRLMDFLRRFVRKRRERRSNTLYKYEHSWDGNDDNTKVFTAKIDSLAEAQSESERPDEDSNTYDEDQTHIPNRKLGVGAAEGEGYPEFVDVDASESYEEYVDNPNDRGMSLQNGNLKQLHNASLPITMPQSSSNGILYTLSSQQQQYPNSHSLQQQMHAQRLTPTITETVSETEDDLFGKSIAVYMKQLSRCHKIKAKVEMFQILAKYIELEENSRINGNMSAIRKNYTTP